MRAKIGTLLLLVMAFSYWQQWWPLFYIGLVLSLMLGWVLWYDWRQKWRAQFIAQYQFPAGLTAKLRGHYPHLTDAQQQQLQQGLRQYFQLIALSGSPLAMPSQAVDSLWHEFILYTRNYQQFCRKAFGYFLHHHPAEQLSQAQSRAGLRRVWRLACQQQGLDPAKAAYLPLLFALDASLNIANGFHYQLDCLQPREADGSRSQPFCASAMADPGGCAGGDSIDAGCSSSDGGTSCSSSDGGGCGGGCGGGGD